MSDGLAALLAVQNHSFDEADMNEDVAGDQIAVAWQDKASRFMDAGAGLHSEFRFKLFLSVNLH